MADHDHWAELATAAPLAIVTDVDGTLIHFAATPHEARPDAEIVDLLRDLAACRDTTVAVVSGRPRETLDDYFGASPDLLLVAEHGGWRRGRAGGWQATIAADPRAPDDLATELEDLVARYPGALLERKTWALAFHYRGVAPEVRDEIVVDAEQRIGDWLGAHPDFQQLRGADVIEIRPAGANKGSAVPWIRALAGEGARLLALGDDHTDEDTFAELGPGDAAVLVGADDDRASAAGWRLPGPDETVALLRWLLARRRGEPAAEIPLPRPIAATSAVRYDLVVVSNRLPQLRSTADAVDPRKRNVGGLVSALEPALRARQGVWLGWSGRTLPRSDASGFGIDASGPTTLAWVDLPEEWHRSYYNGFCNSALWPLLHSFVARVRLHEKDWIAYRNANQAFAESAARLVAPDGLVWVHDYHLLLLGQRLRERGHAGRLGLFLHVPFPGPDIWFILPWAEEILRALLALDLIGFHTPGYAANFRQCAAALPGARVDGETVELDGHRTRAAAFPIGILPDDFQEPADTVAAREVQNLMRAIAPTRLILGVDRLDYTKGIPERLQAFARMLELHPEWRRKVSLVQISVPSRDDVPEYAEQRRRIEAIVGRANGELGDADWVPIRYLYRSFGRQQLALLYRAAAVGYVTPLRDGMNLVAKEYVAAQNVDDPGVLLLSRFAGAADELRDALLTNPWHIDGMAHDLDRALRLDREERRARHRKLLDAVSRTTALSWAEDFLSALAR
jgi:trehalose 6-phosphate synthase